MNNAVNELVKGVKSVYYSFPLTIVNALKLAINCQGDLSEV